MSVYQTSLLGRTKVADGTMAFHFEKPEGFHFKPGQYVAIPDPGDGSQAGSAYLPDSKLSVMRE